MFDFENANENQKKAIKYTDGPLLIIAGPGTGKTFTLVKRIVYLIEEKNVKPQEIMVVTFTDKAAKELVTRISNELKKNEINVNINDMYIGTFHSICLKIIDENIKYSKIRKNYRIIDEFEQKFFIYKNIERFNSIPGFEELLLKCDKSAGEDIRFDYDGENKYAILNEYGEYEFSNVLPERYQMMLAGYVVEIARTLFEELADFKRMIQEKSYKLYADIVLKYYQLLLENNIMDYSLIQVEVYRMFTQNEEVLKNMQEKIRYIMVDEYQDTSTIQEKLVFLLGEKSQNISVVGDDDQSIYKFRGADVKNILTFKDNFKENKCKVININQNYRSTSEIIDLYNKWMKSNCVKWNGRRLEKEIMPTKEKKDYPSVIKMQAYGWNDWYESIISFIQKMKKEKVIEDYNQVTLLFPSVKSPFAKQLAFRMENAGIDVYNPRAQLYFARDEVKMILAILICVFSDYYDYVKKNYSDKLVDENRDYTFHYIKSLYYLGNRLKSNDIQDVYNWMYEKRKIINNLEDSSQKINFTSLVYEIFSLETFRKILRTDTNDIFIKQRELRNMAIFTDMVAKFENMYNLEYFTKENLNDYVWKFFEEYLAFLCPDKIREYEDEKTVLPKGCVAFMTIHQSKGMEFPIVIPCSLDYRYEFDENFLEMQIEKIKELYGKNYYSQNKTERDNHDYWRKYYTAFSRAQNMLVLTSKSNVLPCFEEIYKEAYDEDKILNYVYKKMEIEKIKESKIKDSYSFTSDVRLYQECPRKYKFFKEFGFTGKKIKSMLFGSLVHQSIEDINKKILENKSFGEEDVENILKENIDTIEKANNEEFTEKESITASHQLKEYLEKNKDNFKNIIAAEQEISVIRDEYIIKGQIDMISKTEDGLEIIDFKTGKKPDFDKEDELIESYEKQISLYAYMAQQSTGEKIDKMTLYYTGEEDPKISYKYDIQKVEKVVDEFDQTVKKIMEKDFSGGPKNEKVCEGCLMKYYCRAEKKSEVENG